MNKLRLKAYYAALICSTFSLGALAQDAEKTAVSDPVVKKSKNNVCYDKSNIGYKKTMSFTPYNSMDECRSDGGRPPKVVKKQ
jgi:hypothetical protein